LWKDEGSEEQEEDVYLILRFEAPRAAALGFGQLSNRSDTNSDIKEIKNRLHFLAI